MFYHLSSIANDFSIIAACAYRVKMVALLDLQWWRNDRFPFWRAVRPFELIGYEQKCILCMEGI